MQNDRSAKADITSVMGVTGTGKTGFVMGELKKAKPSRLLVWDRKGEFAAEGYGQPVHSLGDVIAALKSAGPKGKFAIAYRPKLVKMAEQFHVFCMAAFEAGGLTLIGEELADVTTATSSPVGWRACTTQGRTRRLVIYGLSQTPSQIDKNFFANSSRIVCFAMDFENHVNVMKNCMRVTGDEIMDLPNGAYLELIKRPRSLRKGKVF